MVKTDGEGIGELGMICRIFHILIYLNESECNQGDICKFLG